MSLHLIKTSTRTQPNVYSGYLQAVLVIWIYLFAPFHTPLIFSSLFPLYIKYFVGTFGQVVECRDLEKREFVAIKIVRSIHKYRQAAMIEIDVLQKLAKHDIGGAR